MTKWFWATVVTGATLAAACGGSDDDGSTGGGTSTGSGGSSNGSGGSAGNAGGTLNDSGGSSSDSGGSGNSASGGSAANGGSASGGSAANGGSASGGSAANGGSGGSVNGGGTSSGGSSSGGSAGQGGDGPIATISCGIDVLTSEVSSVIASVGIVEFQTDLEGLESASIEFGRTTTYGMEAPVDLDETDYRTLLMGMTYDSEYHYRIVLETEAGTCVSEDQTLQTGPLPTGAPPVNVTEGDAGEVSPGFILTSVGAWSIIFNDAGELVWAYQTSAQWISRTRLSYDAKHIYLQDLNVQRFPTGGTIIKLDLDGQNAETIELGPAHHDFAVTPDNGFVYLRADTEDGGQDGSCDSVYKFPGETVVYELADAFPSASLAAGDPCHACGINYNAFDGSLTVAVRNLNAFVKIDASNDLEWVLGSDDSDFNLDDAVWEVQYGMHLIDADTMAFFNNTLTGAQSFGRVLSLDHDTQKATFTLSTTLPSSMVLGDAQFLPNTNLLFTSSAASVIHEVTAEGDLVQMYATTGSGFSSQMGFAEHRPTLYGPPPR